MSQFHPSLGGFHPQEPSLHGFPAMLTAQLAYNASQHARHHHVATGQVQRGLRPTTYYAQPGGFPQPESSCASSSFPRPGSSYPSSSSLSNSLTPAIPSSAPNLNGAGSSNSQQGSSCASSSSLYNALTPAASSSSASNLGIPGSFNPWQGSSYVATGLPQPSPSCASSKSSAGPSLSSTPHPNGVGGPNPYMASGFRQLGPSYAPSSSPSNTISPAIPSSSSNLYSAGGSSYFPSYQGYGALYSPANNTHLQTPSYPYYNFTAGTPAGIINPQQWGSADNYGRLAQTTPQLSTPSQLDVALAQYQQQAQGQCSTQAAVASVADQQQEPDELQAILGELSTGKYFSGLVANEMDVEQTQVESHPAVNQSEDTIPPARADKGKKRAFTATNHLNYPPIPLAKDAIPSARTNKGKKRARAARKEHCVTSAIERIVAGGGLHIDNELLHCIVGGIRTSSSTQDAESPQVNTNSSVSRHPRADSIAAHSPSGRPDFSPADNSAVASGSSSIATAGPSTGNRLRFQPYQRHRPQRRQQRNNSGVVGPTAWHATPSLQVNTLYRAVEHPIEFSGQTNFTARHRYTCRICQILGAPPKRYTRTDALKRHHLDNHGPWYRLLRGNEIYNHSLDSEEWSDEDMIELAKTCIEKQRKAVREEGTVFEPQHDIERLYPGLVAAVTRDS